MGGKLYRRFSDRVWLTSILFVGAVIRLIGITHSSIWHDEGYTMMIAPRSFMAITDATARDVHPPLYYYLLHVWMIPFGNSELSVRGMSSVFSLGTVVIVYLIVKRFFSTQTALLAALFTAIAPFMIRFSQEARMYGVIAFFTTAATYVLIRALEKPKNYRLWWLFYAALMLASVYTQYYGFFVLMVHWIYVGFRTVLQQGEMSTRERIWSFINQGWWWIANALIFILYLPWFPIAYSQVTRVNSGYWIQKSWITLNTIPDNTYSFLSYAHLDKPFPVILRDVPFLLIFALMLYSIYHFRRRWREVLFFILYFFLPMTLVWTLSKLRTPVYQDRYFPFAAVGYYISLTLAILSVRVAWLRRALIGFFVVIMLAGCVVVYQTTHHRMRDTGNYVNNNYQPGDSIISLDLYTYFDFSYYNHTGDMAKLFGTQSYVYGEPGLLEGREDLRVTDLRNVVTPSHRVWIIGKTGNHDYYKEIPSSWQLENTFSAGYTEARLYKI